MGASYEKRFSLTKPRKAILKVLVSQGGSLEDSKGHTSSTLQRLLPEESSSSPALAQCLAGMRAAGVLDCEIHNKRTYRISLSPYGEEICKRAGIVQAVEDTKISPLSESGGSIQNLPEAPQTPLEASVSAREVADALLEATLDLVRRHEPADQDMAANLAKTHVANQTLRSEVKNLTSHVARLEGEKYAREERNRVLRRRLDEALERNKDLGKNMEATIKGEVQRKLARFMEEKPNERR